MGLDQGADALCLQKTADECNRDRTGRLRRGHHDVGVDAGAGNQHDAGGINSESSMTARSSGFCTSTAEPARPSKLRNAGVSSVPRRADLRSVADENRSEAGHRIETDDGQAGAASDPTIAAGNDDMMGEIGRRACDRAGGPRARSRNRSRGSKLPRRQLSGWR